MVSRFLSCRLSLLLILSAASILSAAGGDLLVFNELGSGFLLQQDNDSQTHHEIFLASSTYLTASSYSLTLHLYNQKSLASDHSNLFDTSVSFETFLTDDWPGFLSLRYQDNRREKISIAYLQGGLSHIRDNSEKYQETGVSLEWQNLIGENRFNHLDGNVYLLLKDYLSAGTLHHDLIFLFKYLPDIEMEQDLLLAASYLLQFSFPWGKDIGLNLGYQIVHNFSQADSIIFWSDHFQDEFAADRHQLRLELTGYLGPVLLKPAFTALYREYRQAAGWNGQIERGLITSLYVDLFLFPSLLCYGEGFYQFTGDGPYPADIYQISLGFKTQFDIFGPSR